MVERDGTCGRLGAASELSVARRFSQIATHRRNHAQEDFTCDCYCDRSGVAVLWAQQKKALEVYFVDVEGGQSTLFVSPSGQSLLVDTGWAGARDAGRIAGVAKLAGVSQIDYLVLTHYHGDHAGGVVELAGLIPIKNFVDHGPSQEETRNVPQTYAAYLKVRGEGQHILAKPGDKIPIHGDRRSSDFLGRRNDCQTVAGRGGRLIPCARISCRKMKLWTRSLAVKTSSRWAW